MKRAYINKRIASSYENEHCDARTLDVRCWFIVGPMSTTTPGAAKGPHPAAGIVLFFALVLVGRALPTEWALVATPLLILALTALAVVVSKADPRKTLLLRAPTLPDLVMAFPLAISFIVLSDQISSLAQTLVPLDESYAAAMREILRAETASEWVSKILIIGVGAAVSEELMFRGFILTAFRRTARPALAVVSTSLLFMVLHYPLYPASLGAGLVLGFVAVSTRSILVPICVHLANNLAVLLLVNVAELDTLADPVWIPPEILLPALAIFGLTGFYYARRWELPDAEESDIEDYRPPPPPAPIRPISLKRLQPPLSDELGAIPPSRRRLGWVVVATAIATGFLVLVALFSTSVYYVYPERFREAGIELLRQQSHRELTDEASDRAPSIASAFEALSALNESGQLDIMDLAEIQNAFIELNADGGLDARDADILVETIRRVVLAKTRARPL